MSFRRKLNQYKHKKGLSPTAFQDLLDWVSREYELELWRYIQALGHFVTIDISTHEKNKCKICLAVSPIYYGELDLDNDK